MKMWLDALGTSAAAGRRAGVIGLATRGLPVRLLTHLQLCRFKGHSTAAQPAVATGILRQILLVIVLGVKELRRVADFRGDGAVSRGGEPGLISAPRDLGGAPLCLVSHVDRGAVLRTDIVPLSHSLRGIVRLPEYLEQILVSDLGGIINHARNLGVSCLAGTDFFVGWIGSEPTCIADC